VPRNQNSGGQEGAPEWMVTYGDMMGLLLTFFVLLFAFSEPKAEKFQRVLDSLRRAFGGYPSAFNPVPGRDNTGQSIFEKIEVLEQQLDDEEKKGITSALGFEGDQVRVTTVDEGIKITFGGNLLFEDGSAVLKDDAKAALSNFAELSRGFPNLIQIVGHASGVSGDPWGLGYRRAQAVFGYLVNSCALDEGLFQLTSAGKYEPKASDFPGDRASNRRVDIIVSEEIRK